MTTGLTGMRDYMLHHPRETFGDRDVKSFLDVFISLGLFDVSTSVMAFSLTILT